MGSSISLRGACVNGSRTLYVGVVVLLLLWPNISMCILKITFIVSSVCLYFYIKCITLFLLALSISILL